MKLLLLPLLSLHLHGSPPPDSVPGATAAHAVAAYLAEHHLALRNARLELYANAAGNRLAPRLVGLELPDSLTEGVLLAIQANAPVLGGRAPQMAGFRLDRLEGAVPQPPAPEGKYKPPQLANVSYVKRVMEAMLNTDPATEADRVSRLSTGAQLRVRVDADGHVGAAVLDRSTGDPEMDRYMLELAWSMEFHPSTEAGRPATVWTYVPLRFWGAA
jgi:TonB family protein